jgi:FG-GAP-like repeat
MNRLTRRMALAVLLACGLLAIAVMSPPRAPGAAPGGPSLGRSVAVTQPPASSSYPHGNADRLVAPAPASLLLERQIWIRPYPRALAVGDFNRDGRKDVALINNGSAKVSILFGMGKGNFGMRRAFAIPKSADSIAVADLNGGGKQDLIIGVDASYGRQATVSVLLGKGDGTFRARRTYGLGYAEGTRSSATLAIVDLNGDRHPDIVSAKGDRLMVLLGRGNGTFRAAHAYLADSAGSIASFALGKLDGNGAPDAVAGSQEGVNVPIGALSVLLGKGNGGFKAASTQRTDFLIPDELALADVNHDGKRDLLVANTADVIDHDQYGSNYSAIVVSFGRGDGTFSQTAEYDVGSYGPSAFKLADFNGDGNLDLLLASVEGLCLLLGYGDGSFQAGNQFDTTHRVGGALVAVGDFNKDGKPDLAVAGAGGRTLSIFLNRSGVTD